MKLRKKVQINRNRILLPFSYRHIINLSVNLLGKALQLTFFKWNYTEIIFERNNFHGFHVSEKSTKIFPHKIACICKNKPTQNFFQAPIFKE